MSRPITPKTTLDNLKGEAKRWLKAIRANAEDARARLERAVPKPPARPTLRDVQHALAREHGLPGWTALKQRLSPHSPLRRYEVVAEAPVVAYRTGELDAMRVVWNYFGHMRRWEVMRRYVRLDLGRSEEPPSPADDEITLAEAQFLVARAQEFESWNALEQYVASVPPGRPIAAKAVAVFATQPSGEMEGAARSRDWHEVIDLMRSRRLEGLAASGQMTDAILPGHHGWRRRVRRVESFADHRAHLGTALLQSAAARVRCVGRHAGACAFVRQLQECGRCGFGGIATVPGASRTHADGCAG